MTGVRPATSDDVEQMVAIHQQAFAGYFLTSLGSRFLDRFYRSVVTDSGCLSFVAERGGQLQGFVVGPLRPSGFFRRLLVRHGVHFLLDAIPALIAKPGYVCRRLARGLRYRGEAPLRYRRAALVSSIAVAPQATGTGVAGELLAAFCSAAERHDVEYVYLTTDRDTNIAANRFYAKHEFFVDSELARNDGRVMNRYVRALRSRGRETGRDARRADDE